MIRLIATDLDGTLLDERGELPEGNRLSLIRAREAGCKIVICSGRMLDSVTRFAQAIGVNAPTIVFNGAAAIDTRTGACVFSNAIPPEIARRACAIARQHGEFIQAFPAKGFFYEKRVPKVCDIYEGRIQARGQETGIPLSEWIDQPILKLLSLGEPDKLRLLEAEIVRACPQLRLMYSRPTYLEMVFEGVDKGNALREICRIEGISPEEVLAFGDQENDLEMLEFAGLGYAMENATDEVKRRTQYLAPRFDRLGVASVVNDYLARGEIGGQP